jgi:hypothetical protein
MWIYESVKCHTPAINLIVVQPVSRRLPTAEARVRAHVRSCWICGGQSGTGIGFLRLFRFPLPILIPPTARHSSSNIWGWYNRSVSGRHAKWTVSPHPKKERKKGRKKVKLIACEFKLLGRYSIYTLPTVYPQDNGRWTWTDGRWSTS